MSAIYSVSIEWSGGRFCELGKRISRVVLRLNELKLSFRMESISNGVYVDHKKPFRSGCRHRYNVEEIFRVSEYINWKQ